MIFVQNTGRYFCLLGGVHAFFSKSKNSDAINSKAGIVDCLKTVQINTKQHTHTHTEKGAGMGFHL